MNLQLLHLLQSFYYNDNIHNQYIFDSTCKRDNSFDYSTNFSFFNLENDNFCLYSALKVRVIISSVYQNA